MTGCQLLADGVPFGAILAEPKWSETPPKNGKRRKKKFP